MMNQNSRAGTVKKYILNALKIGFVGFVLYFLAQRGFISVEATRRAFTQLDRIIPAVLLLFSTTFLSIIRWQWLLRAQDIHLSWTRVIQLVFVGNFFNIALPGAVSGDFVKAFYVAKEIQGQRGRAFGSILFDRVAGLSALVLVAAGALAADIQFFLGTPLLKGIQFFITFAALVVVAFYTYLFLVREHHDPLLKIFKALEARHAKAGSLTRIYEGLRHYHNHRLTVIKVLALSFITHLTVSYACFNFAYALGETQLPPDPFFVVVPLGLLVTAVPIMPAGVGTGHAAFGALFHFLGSQRGADVFSLFVLTQLFTGAVGGLVYLRFRTHEPKPVLDAEAPHGAITSLK